MDKLSDNEWEEVFDYAKNKKIICFSTPFDEESVDMLDSLNVPAFKIASADITHLPLIRKIAAKKKPVFISTGMSTIEEIHDAISTIENEGNDEIVIMHCITSYPTKPEDANLDMITTLKKEFPEHIIGYSDHTLGTDIAAFSVFYGSKCVEKHFTHDKTLSTSRDHRLSLDSNDFRELRKKIHLVQVSKGMQTRKNINSENTAIKYARRSIVSKTKILKGTKITEDLLEIKRPGTGIQPRFLDKILGKITSKDIEEDLPITWDDLD